MNPAKNLAASLAAGCLLAIAGSASAGGGAAVVTIGSATGTPGSNVVIPVTFEGEGVAVDFLADFSFDPGGLDFVSVSPQNGASCVQRPAPNDNQIRILAPPNATNDPIPPGPTLFCNVTFGIPLAAPEPSTEDLLVQQANCFDNVGDDYPCDSVDGQVNIVGIEGPTVTFTPPAGPLALPGGVQGGTATANVDASTVANPGEVGGADATVDCSITAGAFTVVPDTLVTFTSGTGSSQNFAVSCVRPDEGAGPFGGTMTCVVNDQLGAPRDVVYDLTCPEGVALAGPTLAFDPNGGAFPLPGGIIGNVSNRNIAVNVTDGGEAGGPDATASCTGDAVFSVSGSPVIVSPPAALGTAGNITVSCTLTDTEQNGTVTCNVDGGPDVTFAAVCPAGVDFVLPDPRPVPTMSTWGLYALILVMLGLGAGFAYRRLH
ncbi:MAG TPA: cohesin domain-containing protein [Xanthomonadaceae bacterium]|nr:cohesin domain-containing protein [Xanthomonadaceae bacterium]